MFKPYTPYFFRVCIYLDGILVIGRTIFDNDEKYGGKNTDSRIFDRIFGTRSYEISILNIGMADSF